MIEGYYTNTQALFLPCTYMMARLIKCEQIVVMEEAQFHRKGHHARGMIATERGHEYISLSLSKPNRKPLNEIEVVDAKSFQSVVNKLEAVYRKAPHFNEVWETFEPVIERIETLTKLIDIDLVMMEYALRMSGHDITLIRSMDVLPNRPSNASDWMADLGVACGGKTYYAGETSINAYIEKDYFDSVGIGLECQHYTLPEYENYQGSETNGWICFLDPLFHLGIDGYNHIIRP